MLDSIYHMTLELLKITLFGVKTSRFCHLLCNVCIGHHYLTLLICKLVLLHGVI